MHLYPMLEETGVIDVIMPKEEQAITAKMYVAVCCCMWWAYLRPIIAA